MLLSAKRGHSFPINKLLILQKAGPYFIIVLYHRSKADGSGIYFIYVP